MAMSTPVNKLDTKWQRRRIYRRWNSTISCGNSEKKSPSICVAVLVGCLLRLVGHCSPHCFPCRLSVFFTHAAQGATAIRQTDNIIRSRLRKHHAGNLSGPCRGTTFVSNFLAHLSKAVGNVRCFTLCCSSAQDDLHAGDVLSLGQVRLLLLVIVQVAPSKLSPNFLGQSPDTLYL